MDIAGYKRIMYDTTEINDILTKAKNLNVPSDVTELIADIDDVKQKNIEQDNIIATTNQKLQDVTTKCLYLGKTYGTNEKYIALTDKLTSYEDGVTVTIVPHVNGGNNPTLNINNLGDTPLLDINERPVKLKANKPYTFVRVGSSFFLRSGGGRWESGTTSNIFIAKHTIYNGNITNINSIEINTSELDFIPKYIIIYDANLSSYNTTIWFDFNYFEIYGQYANCCSSYATRVPYVDGIMCIPVQVSTAGMASWIAIE